MGFKSGEYGNKYSILTPAVTIQLRIDKTVVNHTKPINKFKYFDTVVNFGIIHYKST
jgi:hypothetical protein